MKVLPVAPSINKNRYSYNGHKNNYVDNVAFSASAQIIKSNPIKQVNINDIMLSSGKLAENFKALIQREKLLRQNVDSILSTLSERIGDILTENGFSPQHFIMNGNFRDVTVREPRHFFEVFDKLNGETDRISTPGWSFGKWAQAQLADNPQDVLTHVEHRLKLTSKKCPDASLEIYAAQARDGNDYIIKNKHILDINSYTDEEFSLTTDEHHYNSSGSNLFTLKTADIETTCHFKNWYFDLMPINCFLIVDKENNTTYRYINYNLQTIEADNGNTIYNLFDKTITQKFSDKVVIHQLSKDLSSVESIEFRKAENRR